MPSDHMPAVDQPGVADLAAGVVRTSWPWIVAGIAAVAFLGFLLWGANTPDDPVLEQSAGGTTPATPADGLDLTEAFRLIGQTCFHVLVADTPDERASGLRYRESELDRVDGMLFVHDEAQAQPGAFTMSGVVKPLSVGFYDAAGKRVGGHEMEPCPGSLTDCPGYDAPAGWQFAVESKPGAIPDGDLGGECTPPPDG